MQNEECKMQNEKLDSQPGQTKRKGDDLSDRLIDFAVRVGKVVDALPSTRMGRHIAGQLIRSGTSPAPNYAEACGAQSPNDFSHKLAIALKELRETRCWIQLIMRAELLKVSRMQKLLGECEQLCAIIAKSIVTVKTKKAAPPRDP